ncbi:bifunctional DedA family/phosphatase PAP2 family protein [Thiococcus pfennigii]|uniref:bifunctional DedA family/phosphatase PAP2 family protein n=3 Tax=Thiococcus pfennigii TaxID=1057 RepID=UPI001908EED5|nr:bifunctional DedA family/phosphatase PAP2 family protein [Thiococcus pfennigii]MBK1733442.1 membrane-associated protein [Thiococcus pfennigii]
MEALFQQFLAWVAAHPGWANLILFLTALAESLAIVGVLVPGVLIMLVAGALIAAGVLDLHLAWAAATLGAVLGDALSYALGRVLKDHVRRIWPFSRHPESLVRGERFFARYGVKSVVFGRFVGPIRAVVPLIAGTMGMGVRRFLVANVLSAVVWAPAYLLPGIVFGASLTLAAEAATRLVILALILIALLWLAAWTTRRLFWLLSPHAGARVAALLRWADLHPSMGKVARALADPAHPDAATLTGLAGLLILATFLLGFAVSITLIGPAALTVNQAVLDLGLSLRTPPADTLMAGLSRLGDPFVLLTQVLIVFLYLRWRRHRRHANYWLAAAAFALVAAPALGWLLQVPRPVPGLIALSPWSFPGIQVLGATVVYGFLAIAIARGLAPLWRWVPYVLATLLVTAVALARLYFGAEWLSDVIGSIALGLAWIAVLGLAFRRHSQFDRRWPGLVAVAALALAAGFTARTLTDHGANLARYRPVPEPVAIAASAWRDGGWRALPGQRLDLWQHNRHPLDLQYAGAPAQLAERLAPFGWRPAETLTWRSAIRFLSPTLPLAELPVIPHVHDGGHETLVLVKDEAGDDTRLVLRLWSTRYRLDGRVPIGVGNVTVQRKEILAGLFALPITGDDYRPAAAVLAAALAGQPDPGDAAPRLLLLPPPADRDTPGDDAP